MPKLKRLAKEEATTHVVSSMHYVADRVSLFQSRVRMIDGLVAAEWRPITVSEDQWRLGGFTAVGEWQPCMSVMHSVFES